MMVLFRSVPCFSRKSTGYMKYTSPLLDSSHWPYSTLLLVLRDCCKSFSVVAQSLTIR